MNNVSMPEAVPVEIRHITNSELTEFKACRRAWYLGYYRRLSPVRERQVGPLRLGSRVHEALAVLYEGGDPIAAHAAFIERDRALLTDDLLPEELKQFESESVLGDLMLAGYLEWLAETGADQGLSVVSTETKLSAPLGGGLVDHLGRPVYLLGKLDMRVRREMDNAILFLDHKTTKAFGDVFNTILLNEQFLTYQLLERLDLIAKGDADTPPSTGSLVNVLRKVKRGATAKPPFYAREEVHHSDVELRNFWYRVHAEVAEILAVEARLAADEDHRRVCYPRPSRDCSWRCDFVAACHMFEDGSDVERFLADRFAPYDPLARYADDPTEGDQ